MVSGLGVDMEEDRQDLLGCFVQTVVPRDVLFSVKFAIFRSDCLPDPSTLIRYWRTSMTNSCAVPLVWVGASLILDSDSIANTSEG